MVPGYERDFKLTMTPILVNELQIYEENNL